MPIYIPPPPQEAVKAVKSHDHVHISSAAQLPYCLLSALEERADAGEITDIHFHHSYSDGPVPFDAEKSFRDLCRWGLHLIKKGVINGSNIAIDKGKVVASFILGSREVFDFVDHNPGVMMMDVGYTNAQYIISRNPKVASVNTATQIDLTGQVCADSIGSRILSGTGGQLEFVRGAFLSKGGVSIIAITSRTKNGESKIVPALNLASGVVTPRADIQWVVTEYGAVNLLGKSLQERAKLLISIAHPDDRELLEKASFERFGNHFLYI